MKECIVCGEDKNVLIFTDDKELVCEECHGIEEEAE